MNQINSNASDNNNPANIAAGNNQPVLKEGLEGVAIAKTAITDVRGEKGQLIYRGHWIQNLVGKYCYEEIVYLLWYGRLPTDSERHEFNNKLVALRPLSQELKDIIKLMPRHLTPMEVLRSAVSVLAPKKDRFPPNYDDAFDILAKAPTIIAFYYNHINNRPQNEPNPSLSHSANYLYMLHGVEVNHGLVKALDAYLVLCADHGTNASTFTARVITATNSDLTSSLVGAIGALIGPLHGGAPSMVDDMLDAIGSESNIEPWLRKQLENGGRLMGFGHRVYKTYDPRGIALKKIVTEFAHQNPLFQLSLKVEEMAVRLLEEYKPGRRLYPNIEFWAAGVLRTVKLPRQLYTPTFALARIAGWCANIFEQAAHNRLIRPASIYVGNEPLDAPEGTPPEEGN